MARGASELEAHRELRLPRRRVDVREERGGRAEQGSAGRIVCAADVVVRRTEIRAIENVEELRDELGARRAAYAEELREPEVDVREARTVDLCHRRQIPLRPELVDRVEVQRTATREGQDARRQIRVRWRHLRPRQSVIVQIETRGDGPERQARTKI